MDGNDFNERMLFLLERFSECAPNRESQEQCLFSQCGEISLLADHARETAIYKQSIENGKREKFLKELEGEPIISAHDQAFYAWMYLIDRIVAAPIKAFALGSAFVLLPIIDDKLKEAVKCNEKKF